MRVFQLHRIEDVTGVSGTGVVADGVEWDDGTVTVRWRGDRPSTVQWSCIQDAYAVHGHGGKTRLVWLNLAGEPLPDPAPPADGLSARGFRQELTTADTYGHEIRVYASSAAEYNAVWVSIAGSGGAAAHLDEGLAVQVRNALNNWLLWSHNAAAEPGPPAGGAS